MKPIYILLFIALVSIATAIDINVNDEWRVGSEQLIEINAEENSNITLILKDLKNRNIDILNLLNQGKYYYTTYKVPYNFDYDYVQIQIDIINATATETKIRTIKIIQLNSFQRFINWIFGNIFGVLFF